MAEDRGKTVEYDWSWGYFIYRIAYDIAKSEGKQLDQLKRAEYLTLIREIVSAVGGVEKGSIESTRFSR
jgi:hypothetical protein